MASNDPSGFAIRRNGTCLASEVDCGVKLNPFHACCPGGTGCQDSKACCQSSDNCTATLLANPTCGNKTWDLYNYQQPDGNGYFCCDPNARGYGEVGAVGCSVPGALLPDGAGLLPVIQRGETTSTSATSSAAPTATASQAPPSSNSNGSNNAGTIAGAVIGGVILGVLILGAIWFWRRKVKTRAVAQDIMEYGPRSDRESSVPEYSKTPYKVDATNGSMRAEIPDRPRAELGIEERTPSELPGGR